MTETPAALITGSARRIGRAIAEDLARNGWAVAIHHHRSGDEAEELAAEIRDAGGRAAVVSGDLSDPWAPSRIVEDAARALGPFTLLVNNASVFEKDTIGALDAAIWQHQMAVNLQAPVFLAEAFARQLPDGSEGNIVNLLDQRIFRPSPDFFSYQLTKSGLAVATEIMAKALAPRIRVNGIAPGPVLPSVHSNTERHREMVAGLPLQRAPGLDEFGRTIRFLVETPSITGQVIALDGGQRLG